MCLSSVHLGTTLGIKSRPMMQRPAQQFQPVLTTLPEVVRSSASYRDVLYGALLITMVVFRPNGIVGRLTIRRSPPAGPADDAPELVPGDG